MKSEKGISAKDALNTNLNTRTNMNDNTPTQNKFQYECSFCLQNLQKGGIRFDGIGACLRCYQLAHTFVDALREHRANYFNNLGVRK